MSVNDPILVDNSSAERTCEVTCAAVFADIGPFCLIQSTALHWQCPSQCEMHLLFKAIKNGHNRRMQQANHDVGFLERASER